MKKRNVVGELAEYANLNESWNYKEWVIQPRDVERNNVSTSPNIVCKCGYTLFEVCWWDYPHTGGYCKLRCIECAEELVLIDDFA